jgi:hypothetical protein
VALLHEETVDAGTLAGIDVGPFLCAAVDHGVLSLVADRLVSAPGASAELREAVTREARAQVVADVVAERELRAALAALEERGARPLLMKGAALAYTHYARPDLRPRLDTDILISTGERSVVRDALAELGYAESAQPGGELLMYQTTYIKVAGTVKVHAIDVHWKIANAQPVADLYTYAELAQRATSVPALAPGARALGAVDALIVACVHRVAHHFDVDRIVWLFDIHLLARTLSHRSWEQFVATAEERGVANVCAIGLARAEEAFGSAAPDWVKERLDASRSSAANRLTTGYVSGSRRHVTAVLADLRALPDWGDRWRLVREHAFPSRRYMRDVYAPASSAPLAVLYAWRVVRGARKWLARTTS